MSGAADRSPGFGRAVRALAALVMLGGSAALFWSLTRVDLGRHAFLGDRQSLADEAGAAGSGAAAQKRARLIERAFDDAQGFWARTFDARAGRPYRPAGIVFFSRATPSPCAGPNGATGHFYCPATGDAAFDLVFSDELSRRLLRDPDMAEALLVGYVVAARVQDQTGRIEAAERRRRGAAGARESAAIDADLALNADCLAGVWAADAAARLGAPSERLYRDTMLSARRAAAALAASGPEGPVSLNLIGAGDVEARGAAFAKGLESAVPSACSGS